MRLENLSRGMSLLLHSVLVLFGFVYVGGHGPMLWACEDSPEPQIADSASVLMVNGM